MDKYIKKDLNYEIPPIGPVIYENFDKDKILLFLDYTINRINEIENDDKPISYMEYLDLSLFLYDCIGYIIHEKDTKEHYFYDEIIRNAYNKINNLFENRQVYVDLPDESLNIVIDDKLYLSINLKRSTVRYSINYILEYLNDNEIISDKIIKEIKNYIDRVLELEIFKKDDLKIFFSEKWQEILFK